MIDPPDGLVGSLGLAAGWLAGARQTMKRQGPWVDMRLVRLTGERPDDYVETRDSGRASWPARLWWGRDYRYIVRHYRDGELVEEIRYRNPHDALDHHKELAG